MAVGAALGALPAAVMGTRSFRSSKSLDAADERLKRVMTRRKACENSVPADLVVDELADATVRAHKCLVSLRASLKNYVDAGTDGALTSEIIATLMSGLDAVQAYSERGNTVVFTLDELMPFCELVTAHTPILANAYQVKFDEPDASNGGLIVSLRRHLEAQNKILTHAA